MSLTDVSEEMASWLPPKLSDLRFNPNNLTQCDLAGNFRAEWANVLQNNGSSMPQDVVANYLKSIMPEGHPLPAYNAVLGSWYQYLSRQYRDNGTDLEARAIEQKLLDFPTDCSRIYGWGPLCKHLEWNGDADVSGRGVGGRSLF
jgi:hypothetical protein